MTRMTGTRFLAEALSAYDVTHLFYVPSVLGGLMPLLHITGVAATAGFYFWSRHPARIYLGESGSLGIGLLIFMASMAF